MPSASRCVFWTNTKTTSEAGLKKLLTINAGSSSIKYALFDESSPSTALRSGVLEGLGVGGASHAQALAGLLQQLGGETITAVGHRVVHGGTRFTEPARVDAAVLAAIAALLPLAPLHQPHNLAGLRAAMTAFPGVPQVACFDTAFHSTMTDVRQRFALPQALYDRGIRRYGFHGLSYASIAQQLQQVAPRLAAGRVVVAHLGNGASMCALQGGRSVATTMSFSPLDGLPSGTRCGRLDPAVVLHLMRQEGLSADAVEHLLARESGWLGLSGQSADMRHLLASESASAQLAVRHLVECIAAELAGLAAALRGLDALVFTGGVGENAVGIRRQVLEAAAWLGLQLDASANQRGVGCITAPGSTATAWVLRTNEEAVIAQQTLQVLQRP
jgi:acetate kinase